MFQYHSGPIKSRPLWAEMQAVPRFNTTLVQLKEHTRSTSRCRWLRFNTTLVQLKELSEIAGTKAFKKFQYHSGPIKSKYRVIRIHRVSESFNTTLVQLKGLS